MAEPLSPSDLVGPGAKPRRGALSVGGRVLAQPGPAELIVSDALASIAVRLAQPFEGGIGELVEVSGVWRGGTLRAAAITSRAPAPTPSGTGEFARLAWSGVGARLVQRARLNQVVRAFFEARDLHHAGHQYTKGRWRPVESIPRSDLFYAARELETSIAETRHHRERFLRATQQPRMELDMRVYRFDLDGRLHDIRGRRRELPTVYHIENYAGPQRLARTLRAEGSNGIAYDSVRRDGGQCAAVFRPRHVLAGAGFASQ